MKKPNYYYERVAMVESLFLDFEICKDAKKKAELRYKILELTQKLRFDLAKLDLNSKSKNKLKSDCNPTDKLEFKNEQAKAS